MKSSISIWTAIKYLSVCISILCTLPFRTAACGPDFTGWQFSWLLEHYTFNHPYFSYQFDPSSQFYNKSWREYNENAPDYHDQTAFNINAWRTYLQLTPSTPDSNIKLFIYQNTKENLHTKNTIQASIDGKKNAANLWQYLTLLHDYKNIMIPAQNDWDYGSYTKGVGIDTIMPFVKSCEQEIAKTNDLFIQWRLLYLALRASHFNKHYALAVSLFEKHYPLFTKDNSIAQYWCEGMYAGALLRLKQYGKSIYYSARAFANCQDQKSQAMNTYLFSNRDWQSALAFCTNANDSIYVAMLEGANHTMPNMAFIQLVYQTNPQSEVLKFLWLREASKIEEFLLSKTSEDSKYFYYMNGDTPINMDSMYTVSNTLAKFIQLSGQIINNPLNLPAKTTVANTTAYYYYKTNKPEQANSLLASIASSQKDSIELNQYNLLKTLLTLKKDKKFETQSFISLIQYFKSIPYGSTNNHIGYYLLYNEIAPHYLAMHDTVAAFWTYAYAHCYDADSFHIYASDYSPESFNYANFATYLLNQHFSIAQIETLKNNFLTKKGKSDFETYLIQHTQLDEGIKLFDLVIARKYMLNEQWEDAIKLYEQCPLSFTSQLGPNPANFYINDYIETDSSQLHKNTFTVKQILQLAQKLKALADQQTPASAKDKLLYATLLYNMSYYGKNHYILDNHWYQYGSNTAYFRHDSINTHLYINDQDVYEMPLHQPFQNYFHLYHAEKYLQLAQADLSNPEDKTQCAFLLAKCWQKRCPSIKKYNEEYQYFEDLSDYVGNAVKNPYFAQLASQVQKTKLQEQIFNTCSYYRMYLKKK